MNMDRNEISSNYPGLSVEKNRNGSIRYRVRVEGEPRRKISLDVPPSHPLFDEAYLSARVGERVTFKHEHIAVVASTGDLSRTIRSLLTGAKSRADAEGGMFALSKGDILEMINEQEGKCALTGIPFDLSDCQTPRRPFAPSIDRIAQKGDYTRSNVRLTNVAANIARSDWSDDVLLAVAEGILKQGVPQS